MKVPGRGSGILIKPSMVRSIYEAAIAEWQASTRQSPLAHHEVVPLWRSGIRRTKPGPDCVGHKSMSSQYLNESDSLRPSGGEFPSLLTCPVTEEEKLKMLIALLVITTILIAAALGVVLVRHALRPGINRPARLSLCPLCLKSLRRAKGLFTN